MRTLWYEGPSGDEAVPNPGADAMRDVLRRGDDYWGPYSPVGVLAWHEHPPQPEPTLGGLGTLTQRAQLLFIRHPKRGWFFEFHTSNEPEHRWLVPLDPAGDREKWVKHWAYGEPAYLLTACFVSQAVAEQVVADFVATGEPSPAVGWATFDALQPRQDAETRRQRRREARHENP